MGWRTNRRAMRLGVDRITAEAEAIVHGRVVQRGAAGEIPAWVRLNELGHGDWEHLTDLARGVDIARWRSWDGAVRFMAGELVNVAGDPAALLELQRSAVIPLELDMLSGGHEPATPSEFVQLMRMQVAKATQAQRIQVPNDEAAPKVRRSTHPATRPTRVHRSHTPGVKRLPKSGR